MLRAASLIVLAAGNLLAPTGAGAGRGVQGPRSPEGVQDRAAVLAEGIRAQRDNVDPEWVRELSNLGTASAAAYLEEFYELFATVAGRRRVLRGLAHFDGVPEAESRALGKLLSVATESSVRELRDEAVDSLAGCVRSGKVYLARIVDSPAHDEVRVRALRHHVAEPRVTDADWYRELWNARPARATVVPSATDKPAARYLPELGALAFSALARWSETGELVRATGDRRRSVRWRALTELTWRDAAGLEELFEERYSDTREWPRVRAAAAAGLAARVGERALMRFAREGGEDGTPFELRMALARIVGAELTPPLLTRVKKLARSRVAHGRLFALEALARAGPEVALDVARELLDDSAPIVRAAACRLVAAAGDASSIERLQRILRKDEHPEPISASFSALVALRKGDPTWPDYLQELLAGERSIARNAALTMLGASGDARVLPQLAMALGHDDWSTRVAAVRALAEHGSEYAISALVRRMADADPRLTREIADGLWRLTGRPYGTDHEAWRRWWIVEIGRFRVPPVEELALAEEERLQRLEEMRSTRAEFFGIRIESARLAFVIDTSGSMGAPTGGRYAGELGPPRLEVAQAELRRALARLDHDSLFNLVHFSTDARRWNERCVASDEESRAAAFAWIDDLAAGGATNLFGALTLALDDPEVDTLYVLSDGEPAGEGVIDPLEIRRRIAERNEHRRVMLHCIAVGGGLDLLEGLAEDSGGSYVRIP